MAIDALVGRAWSCTSTTWSGSTEMPRVIVGLGSVREPACAFPLRANIAEGFD